jgi:hypothetical protein
MSSTSGFVGSFIGPPHAGGGVGGIDSPGAPTAIADFNPEVVQAASVNGFVLQNATPTILATTVVIPNDGNNHLLQVVSTVNVSSTETGGAVQLVVTDGPTGRTATVTIQAGGSGTGLTNSTTQSYVVGPGSTVQINQSSALSAGAATFSARVLYC